MNPSIERAHAFISKVFDRAKHVAFHAFVEVRIRERVGKSVSRLVDKLRKKRGARGEGRDMGVKAVVIVERANEASATPSQPEQATTPSQQDAIPNNDSRASSEAIAKDEITNNDSSAPNTLQPYNPNTLPPTPDVELDSFPPITRRNFYKHPIFWARFLGYAIPLSFLLYVLYLNYLPFGYHKTFTINVGSPNDTKVSEFYLEPSKDLSDRMTAADGTTYRELNGMATAVFKPNAVLKDAEITVSVEGGEGISLIPPVIDFDPDSVEWDYSWDFSKGVPEGLINLDNKAFPFEDGTYFNGDARVEMASSSNSFETESFAIYAEWFPTDNTKNFQEIIGHYNWELLQEKSYVTLQIGRTTGSVGAFHKISYPVDQKFFNARHSVYASYEIKDGLASAIMYIDGVFAGQINLNKEKIRADYGNNNLTLGKSEHGIANFYKGLLYNVKISNTKKVTLPNKTIILKNNFESISVTSNTTSTFLELKLHAKTIK